MENDDVLVHHGILGQRWGVRRTSAQLGNKSNSSQTKKKDVFGSKKSSSDSKKSSEDNKSTEEKKKEILKSRSAAELYKNSHLFSDQELQAAYNRLSLERNIKNLVPEEVNRGKEYVDKLIKVTNKASEVTESGTRLYNNMAKIYNSTTDEGKKNPWPIISSKDNKK